MGATPRGVAAFGPEFVALRQSVRPRGPPSEGLVGMQTALPAMLVAPCQGAPSEETPRAAVDSGSLKGHHAQTSGTVSLRSGCSLPARADGYPPANLCARKHPVTKPNLPTKIIPAKIR